MSTVAYILAGGNGARFGGPFPKQLVRLAGQPILEHTLRRFDRPDLLETVVIAANLDWLTEIEECADRALRRVPYEIVPGGSSRNASVANCVAHTAAADCKVLIHDAVRPLVTEDLLCRVLESLDRHRGVIPVVPAADPVVRVEGGKVVGFGDRRVLLRGQSPQGFWLDDLRAVFRATNSLRDRDTVFEVMRDADPLFDIGTVEGDAENLKITVPLDHVLAARLIAEI